MKSRVFVPFLLLLALLAIPGAAGAQQAGQVGQVAVINGSSTDAVSVAVGGSVLAEGLEYGADAVAAVVPAGTQTVGFTGGSADASVRIDVAAGSAQTVVSGYGEDGATAHVYPVELTPIAAGTAKVTVWNATTAPVEVSIDGATAVTVEPGAGVDTVEVTAGQSVDVAVGGVTQTVATDADSYTDVFAVDDGTTPALALSIIPSMDALIAALQPDAPAPTAVPDVVGSSLADARAVLESAGLVVATLEVSSEVEAGTVIGTNPTAGVLVAPGTTVTVVVSSGPSNVIVPDVVGFTEAAAENALEAAGLVVAITEETDTEVQVGLVVSTNPAAGTEVAPGSSVTVVVAAQATSVEIPDVTGQPRADAKATLEDAGLRVVEDERSSSDVAEGAVIETDPAAGAEVAIGSVVTMIVSSGVLNVFVPDFAGMSREQAAAEAERALLTITFVEDPDEPDPNGIVVNQAPGAGEFVPSGTEVVAQLSPRTGEAWVILQVDPNRLMTVSGINFRAGSTVTLTVEATNLRAFAAVDDNGFWAERFDLSGIENPRQTLLVQGTAADGSEYVGRFVIPPSGITSDPEVEEGGGFPWWAWLLIGLGVVAAAAAGAFVWRRRSATQTWPTIPDFGPRAPSEDTVEATTATDEADVMSDRVDTAADEPDVVRDGVDATAADAPDVVVDDTDVKAVDDERPPPIDD